MTFDEAVEVGLDVFAEYLPKAGTKAAKKELLEVFLTELIDLGALQIEEEEEEEEPSEEEDLVSLMRNR